MSTPSVAPAPKTYSYFLDPTLEERIKKKNPFRPLETVIYWMVHKEFQITIPFFIRLTQAAYQALPKSYFQKPRPKTFPETVLTTFEEFLSQPQSDFDHELHTLRDFFYRRPTKHPIEYTYLIFIRAIECLAEAFKIYPDLSGEQFCLTTGEVFRAQIEQNIHAPLLFPLCCIITNTSHSPIFLKRKLEIIRSCASHKFKESLDPCDKAVIAGLLACKAKGQGKVSLPYPREVIDLWNELGEVVYAFNDETRKDPLYAEARELILKLRALFPLEGHKKLLSLLRKVPFLWRDRDRFPHPTHSVRDFYKTVWYDTERCVSLSDLKIEWMVTQVVIDENGWDLPDSTLLKRVALKWKIPRHAAPYNEAHALSYIVQLFSLHRKSL